MTRLTLSANYDSVCKNKEAVAVLEFNDACARIGCGRFFWIPEDNYLTTSKTSEGVFTVLHHKSTVPRLLYAHHVWSLEEKGAYLTSDVRVRWDHVQSLRVKLDEMEVIPIELVINAAKITSFTWPANTVAKLAIYASGTLFKLSWMSVWAGRAILDEEWQGRRPFILFASIGPEAYTRGSFSANTAQVYKPKASGGEKLGYYASLNSVGHNCGAPDLPEVLQRDFLLAPPSAGVESVPEAAVKLKYESSEASAGVKPQPDEGIKLNLLSAYFLQKTASTPEGVSCWVEGQDIVKALAKEDEPTVVDPTMKAKDDSFEIPKNKVIKSYAARPEAKAKKGVDAQKTGSRKPAGLVENEKQTKQPRLDDDEAWEAYQLSRGGWY